MHLSQLNETITPRDEFQMEGMENIMSNKTNNSNIKKMTIQQQVFKSVEKPSAENVTNNILSPI